MATSENGTTYSVFTEGGSGNQFQERPGNPDQPQAVQYVQIDGQILLQLQPEQVQEHQLQREQVQPQQMQLELQQQQHAQHQELQSRQQQEDSQDPDQEEGSPGVVDSSPVAQPQCQSKRKRPKEAPDADPDVDPVSLEIDKARVLKRLQELTHFLNSPEPSGFAKRRLLDEVKPQVMNFIIPTIVDIRERKKRKRPDEGSG